MPVAAAMALLLGASAAVGAMAGCEPDIDQDPVPAYFEFDPSANPPRVPLPNVVLQNQETGLLDYGLPNIPAICQDPPAGLTQAQCHFYLYMQTLDGFPTRATLTAPVSDELDMATVVYEGGGEDTLVVVDGSRYARRTDLAVSFDDATRQLVVARPDGWDTDRQYIVAVRGYDDGVRTLDGRRVVAPTAYNLLKREESLLNCEPDPPDPQTLVDPVVDHDCQYFQLLAQAVDPGDASAIAAVEQTLIDLERLRQGFIAAGLWEGLPLLAGMEKEEVAMVWAFPVHSGPVAELDPTVPLVPQVVDTSTVNIPVRGAVDPLTVTPHLGGADPGTVLLFDMGSFAAGDATVIPAFDATYLESEEVIQIQTHAPLSPGNVYVIAMATTTPFETETLAILGDNGSPMAPAPVTVFLRSPYPVFETGTGSLVDVLPSEAAQTVEDLRQQIAPLLDDARFPLSRERIGYLFMVQVTAP